MTVAQRSIAKYMKKACIRPCLPCPPEDTFRCMAVIPVMDELDELPETLHSAARAMEHYPDKAAVMLVVNHPADSSIQRKKANAETLRLLNSGGQDFCGGLIPGRNLFWIDCTAPGTELRNGVGEARRIGMDTALTMLESPEKSFLLCLDADSRAAAEYFVRADEIFAANPDAGAASLKVRHRPGKTPAQESAIREYEKYLDDYVNRLRQAGSPYAFHTIGSAIAVRGKAYIQAGGMRMRQGGEDFYFLQAVSKTAPVIESGDILVFPSPRISDRVPFGTGPAMKSLLSGKPLPRYPEQGFAELQILLRTAAAEDMLNHPDKFKSALLPHTVNFLTQEKFFAVWPDVLRNTPENPEAVLRAFHLWFDGLKTLRFLHSFKQQDYSSAANFT